MDFISTPFLLFLAIIFVVYFITPGRFQWIVLLAASYVFYLFSGVATLAFLLFTTIVTFYTALMLGKANDQYAQKLSGDGSSLTKEQKQLYKDDNKRKKRLILLVALLVNFGILAFLKYFNFFALNANVLLKLLPVEIRFPELKLLLPLGISFYTFQSTGYVIDVYRGKHQPDRHLAKFALFVSFFPQIVQGPISRYDDLAHQLYAPHAFDYTRTKYGLQLMLWGFFKKMVIADRAALIVNTVFKDYLQQDGVIIFTASMLYYVQIYCDFSGGIDIASGVAQVMGIALPKNFERPFFAKSIGEFWRRWHITLSSWMRDYIFYPLSLSKSFARLGKSSRRILGTHLGKLLPTFLAMLITFLAVGIWHGASWKYAVYGIYNGLLIFLEILLEPFVARMLAKWNIKADCSGWRIFQMLCTFLLVCIGRYFSRATSFTIAWEMLKRTFSTFNPKFIFDGTLLNLGLDQENLLLLGITILILFAVDLLQEKGFHLRERISKQNIVFRWSLYMAAIFSILIFGMYGIKYDAASFIYMGF